MSIDTIALPGLARAEDARAGSIPFATARSMPLAVLRVLLDGTTFYLAALLVGAPPDPAALFGLVGALVTRRVGRRRSRLLVRVFEEVPSLAARVAATAMLFALAPLTTADRTTWLLAGPLALVLLLVGRGLSNRLTAEVRREGIGLEEAVIVGGGPVGLGLASVLVRRPEFGLEPIGFLEVDEVDHELPTLGEPTDLVQVLLSRNVRRVVVAFSGSRESELVNVLRDCAQLQFDHRIHVLPRFFELGVASEHDADDLWGFPLVPLRRPGPTPVTRRVKRVFDVSIAALLLIAVAPIYAAVALAVKLSSPGPILFRQKRVGQYGQIFEMLKFRTMVENDDSDTQWSVDDDDRVTSVGRFLRPTHLDELPQLINVLRGDMALVGPRPERPTFVEQFSVEHRGYEDRHRVPVGLTGWAQVNGLWGDTSIEDRARFDNAYIENWSLWRELSIMLKTVPTLLGRRADDHAPDDDADDVAVRRAG